MKGKHEAKRKTANAFTPHKEDNVAVFAPSETSTLSDVGQRTALIAPDESAYPAGKITFFTTPETVKTSDEKEEEIERTGFFSTIKGKLLMVTSALLLSGLLAYCIICSSVIYPANSVLSYGLGAVDIGFQTTEKAKTLLSDMIESYSFQIKGLNDLVYQVGLSDIVTDYNIDGILQRLVNKRKAFFRTNYILPMQNDFTFDSAKVQTLLEQITAEQGDPTPSEDAKVSFDTEKSAFVIQPEKQGNIMTENASEILERALADFQQNIDLLESGCYIKPILLKDDPSLQAKLDIYNTYAKAKIVFQANGVTEELLPDQYCTWIDTAEDGTASINEDQLNNYVNTLNQKYTTCGAPRSFTTSTGAQITLQQGDYGWILNTEKFRSTLKEKITAQDSTPSDLPFSQYAAVLGGDRDFAQSYVEVSIDDQELWMYLDGKLIVDTPVVTGCVDKGYSTPKGIYSLTYKTRDAVLRGEGYETPVSYWMPFNGGVGLHDASWRDSFGDDIYIYGGSHGCVNIPPEQARIIYNNLGDTMPIIVW